MKGKVDGTSRGGSKVSLLLETPIGKKSFSFRPSLSYVQKGQTQPVTGLVDKKYIALRYTELTSDFLYNKNGRKGGFYIGAGPSIAFNLPSKNVSVTGKVKTTSNVKFGTSAAAEMRGIDYGANFTAGWRTNGGFILSLNYNKGIRNLVVDGATGSLKNQYFGIQMGCFINNNIKK